MSSAHSETKKIKEKNPIKLIATILNAAFVLIVILLVFTGDYITVGLPLGVYILLNHLVLSGVLNEKHPYISMSLSALSIICNIGFALIGIFLLFLDKGISGLLASFWVLSTAIAGVYYAHRLWKEIPIKTAFHSINPHILFEHTPLEKLPPVKINTEHQPQKTKKQDNITTIVIFSLIALFIYPMISPTFFPSESWLTIAKIIILMITGLSFIYILKIILTERINAYSDPSRKKQSPFIALLGPAVIWFVLYSGFCHGFGHIYTNIFGSEIAQVIPVEKTDREQSSFGRYIRSTIGYCLDSPMLKRSLFSDLCLPTEKFNATPYRFFMTVIGKKSFFGTVYDKYVVSDIYAFDDPKKREEGIESPAYAEAEYKLGLRYFYGRDLQQNLTKAIKHLEPAAYQGHNKARFLLGTIYFYGEGDIKQDFQKATFWLEPLAEQGHLKALKILSIIRTQGMSFPQ